MMRVHTGEKSFNHGVNSTRKKAKGRLMRGLESVVKEAKKRSKVKVGESGVHSGDIGHVNPPQRSEIQAQANSSDNEGFGGVEGDDRALDVGANDKMEHSNRNNKGHKSGNESLAEQGTMINDHGRLGEHPSDSQLVEEGQGLAPNSHDTLEEMPMDMDVGCFETVCTTKGLRLHRSAKGQRVLCETCGKMFSNKYGLSLHIRFVHNGERPFGCTACGKGFSDKSHLKIHIGCVHTAERRFECTACGKRFPTKNRLENHIRFVHNGERPFGCTACGKRFPFQSSLNKHMRVHNGERPFGCTACGKSFSYQWNLTTHMRVHTGEKPFSCPECAMRQRSALISHFKVHHADRPFSSEDSNDGGVHSARKKVKGRLMRGLEPVVKEAKRRSKVKVDESGVHSGDIGHKTRRLRGSKKIVSNSNGELAKQCLFGGVSLGTPEEPENDKKEDSNLNNMWYSQLVVEDQGTGDPNSHDIPLHTLEEMPMGMDVVCFESK